jgi:hypothetical protein
MRGKFDLTCDRCGRIETHSTPFPIGWLSGDERIIKPKGVLDDNRAVDFCSVACSHDHAAELFKNGNVGLVIRVNKPPEQM